MEMQKSRDAPYIGPFKLILEHMSRNYWIGWVETYDTEEPVDCVEVEFQVDELGLVSDFGFRPGMDSSMVWLKRT